MLIYVKDEVTQIGWGCLEVLCPYPRKQIVLRYKRG